jgi:hypothetical protein
MSRDPRDVPELPTLVEFLPWLRARLDEDEQVARAALQHENVPGVWNAIGSGTKDDHDLSYWAVHQVAVPRWSEPSARDLMTHIARHDPARVLAEVAATRRIVDEHGPYGGGPAGRTDPTACGVCVDWDEAGYDGPPPATAPCLTLRLLALSYADHPDYRDDWRP